MGDHRHYLPILKGKAGEYDALDHLSPGVKPQVRPIIEVPPVESKYGGELGMPTGPKTTIGEHVSQVAENIRRSWGTVYPVYIDLLHVQEHGCAANGTHPLAYVFDQTHKLGVQAIPVTGLDRPNEYQNAVIDAVQRDARGVCIRVDRQQCSFPTSLAVGLQDLIMTLKVGRDQADVILDLGAISPADVNELQTIATSVISELPYIDDWRTVGVGATAMPESVTRDVRPFSINRIDRAERRLWAAIANERDLPRIPNFCDYGVTHPAYFDLDPREVSFAGKIRYTAEGIWVIVKGCKLEGAGDQFHRLAQILTEQPEFCPNNFSWGDESIEKCAALEIGPGNQTTWVAFTTNHHLKFVTEQLASDP
jgi:hypothetical protein